MEWIINLAPFGILGLVFKTISDKVLPVWQLRCPPRLLIATMAFVAFIINPLIAFLYEEKSYPLVLKCLRQWYYSLLHS